VDDYWSTNITKLGENKTKQKTQKEKSCTAVYSEVEYVWNILGKKGYLVDFGLTARFNCFIKAQ
jgi:hypothetical protein